MKALLNEAIQFIEDISNKPVAVVGLAVKQEAQVFLAKMKPRLAQIEANAVQAKPNSHKPVEVKKPVPVETKQPEKPVES